MNAPPSPLQPIPGRGAAVGFCTLMGFVIGSMGITVGFMLCLTVVGAIIGIPLILVSLGFMFGGPIFGLWATRKAKK